MLLLTSATQALKVTSSSTSALDLHASWVDNASGVIAASSANALVTTATTTTAVSAPSSGVQRNIKFLAGRNHGGSDQAVTVSLYDGATAYQLFGATLATGESFAFAEGAGWVVYDPTGAAKTQPSTDSVLRSATLTLTDSQIKGLPTATATAPVIVPAPGAGKMVVPFFSHWFADTTAGAYTNLQTVTSSNPAGCTLYLAWDAANHYNDASGFVDASSMLGSPRKSWGYVGPDSNNVIQIGLFGESLPLPEFAGGFDITAGYENADLNVVGQNNFPSNLGNFTGGNAANTLTVTVYYAIAGV
jgi:hypothetical protein